MKNTAAPKATARRPAKARRGERRVLMSAPCYRWVARRPFRGNRVGPAIRRAYPPPTWPCSARFPPRSVRAAHRGGRRVPGGRAAAGRRPIVTAGPSEVVVADGEAAFDALEHLTPGWWAGYPVLRPGPGGRERRTRVLDADPALPDLVLARYDARLVIDAEGARFEGSAVARPPRSSACSTVPRGRCPSCRSASPTRASTATRSRRGSVPSIRLIEAGDCYQVNLTRQLTWDDAADADALYRALACGQPRAARGAAACSPAPTAPIAIVSRVAGALPRVGRARRARRGRSRAPASTASALRAEREGPCRERHDRRPGAQRPRPGVRARDDQGSGAVRARASPGARAPRQHRPGAAADPTSGPAALVRATFPPASVTGAPKPRVLQAIEDLEPVRRGVYCGAVGWLDTDRRRGRPRGRDPHVHDRRRTDVPRRRRRDRGRLRPGRGVAETELKAARLARGGRRVACHRAEPRDRMSTPLRLARRRARVR